MDNSFAGIKKHLKSVMDSTTIMRWEPGHLRHFRPLTAPSSLVLSIRSTSIAEPPKRQYTGKLDTRTNPLLLSRSVVKGHTGAKEMVGLEASYVRSRKGRLVYAPRGWGTWRQISFIDEALDGENESVDYRGASEASSRRCEQNEPKNSWIDQGLVEKRVR
ncbi:hypothetical protein C8R44DRAFT_752795 [Mycena epipterygia]|nr:hypothetical protein C8R44DRAFT_752795 [Mycena epipterygia]